MQLGSSLSCSVAFVVAHCRLSTVDCRLSTVSRWTRTNFGRMDGRTVDGLWTVDCGRTLDGRTDCGRTVDCGRTLDGQTVDGRTVDGLWTFAVCLQQEACGLCSCGAELWTEGGRSEPFVWLGCLGVVSWLVWCFVSWLACVRGGDK